MCDTYEWEVRTYKNMPAIRHQQEHTPECATESYHLHQDDDDAKGNADDDHNAADDDIKRYRCHRSGEYDRRSV